MKVGLIDVDGSKKFPNLALMKISAYHKSRGDTVEWAYAMEHYDIVYQSRVFDDTYSRDIDWIPNADVVIKGDTGYGLDNVLPDEIEHQYPDYGLYPDITKDTAYGFLSRGCPRHCEFCIVGDKEGLRSVKVADLSEFWRGQKYILKSEVNHRKDIMMRYIEGWHNGLDEVITEYREVFTALEDFENWVYAREDD